MIKAEFFNIINKSFLKIQKLVAVFVLVMILLNNFIPKNLEMKNNFMAALNCAVNAVQVNIYDQYSGFVSSVVNSVVKNCNISTVMGKKLIKKQNQKSGDNKDSNPINTSSDSGIIIQNNTNNQTVLLKVNLTYLIYETINKIYNIYENININNSKNTANMGILFFILFSILVVRIKDTIAVILNKNRILNRLA